METLSKPIPLAGGAEALVDPEMWDQLSAYQWYALKSSNTFYAVARCPLTRKHIRMHRLIMGAPAGIEVDHTNGDGLDNRASNLRFATRRLNCANMSPRRGTSKYKGVHWYARHKKWAAQITVDKKHQHLGYYTSEQVAARAYNQAALLNWGVFARLNMIEEAEAEVKVA